MPEPVTPAPIDSLKIASSGAPSSIASHASSGAVGAVVALAATLEGWQRVAVLGAVLVAIVLLALISRLRPATSGVTVALLLLLPVPAAALPNMTDMPGAGAPPLLAQAAPGGNGPAVAAQPPQAAPAGPAEAPPPAVALDPRLPLCPPAPTSPPSTADKLQRWIAIGAAALAGAALLVEKIDAAAAGRQSVTP